MSKKERGYGSLVVPGLGETVCRNPRHKGQSIMAVSAMLLMLVGGLQGNNIQYYD
ncbi:MAG: hypothetical protein GY696_04235 [Gammaproteobacteria bacterium]|nr:hypothetical protein [Gammaproteobacteria bacterium]